VRLNEIRLRERRTTLAATFYTFAGWGLYVSLWYTQLLPRLGFTPSMEQLAKGTPVILGPIFALLTRRLVQLWYTRKADAEERSLREMSKTYHSKMEEVKKATNYYQVRDMVAKYDGSPGTGSPTSLPIQPRPQTQQPSIAIPRTPQRLPNQRIPINSPDPLQTPARNGLQYNLSPAPSQPLPPPRKQWYDKLADAILGDDDSAAAAASRFALICQKCFAHNGLVEASRWEDTQYVCPKCGHFNPSARTQRQAAQSPSRPQPTPQSPPTTISPVANERTPRKPSNLRHSMSPTADPNASPEPANESNNSMSMEVDS